MTDDISLPRSLQSGSGTLVSVIVPTYGDAEYLPDALESIAVQTHNNIEVIVVDGTGVGWLETLAGEVEGFVYVREEPAGPSAARNRGIAAASGEVVAFLDADDSWHPKKLDRQLAAFEAGADVVYSDVYIVENGTCRQQTSLPVTDSESHHVEFLRRGGVPFGTVAVRRECLGENPFAESLRTAEDRHLLVRLFRVCEPARIAEPLAYYRRREGSLSSDFEALYRDELVSLHDLLDRFPELEPYREELEGRASYARGKRLLRAGRSREARRALVSVLTEGYRDHRVLALFVVSLLPFGHRHALRTLETVQERFRG